MQGSAPQGKKHLLPHHSTFSTEYHSYAFYLARIINSIQQFYDRGQYNEAQIATEIAIATEDHIHLHFLRQSPASAVMLPYVSGRRSFLVRWGEEIYGSLQVKLIEDGYDQHILPISLCERLALDCGWSLHILERERERQWQQQKGSSEATRKVAALSPAQYKVLELMVKGESTRVIAERLHLSKRTIETHQRNIYQMLEVHSQREAVLIGLAAGLGQAHSYEHEDEGEEQAAG
jgi:DNA-binding CsgD family transcriptional regulator